MMRNILYLSILLLLASCSVSRIGYIYKSIDDNPVVVFENDDCHAALQFFLDFDDVVKIDNEPVENALKSGYTVTTGPGNWKVYNEKVDVNYLIITLSSIQVQKLENHTVECPIGRQAGTLAGHMFTGIILK
jgi:hypothetical protein